MLNDKKRIDLHTHTTASDGRITPKELVNKAKKIGLSAIAITDHDTVSGIEEAVKEGEILGVEVIPGIELTCRSGYQEVHVLGYFLDYKSEKLIESLESIRSRRAKKPLSFKDYISIIIDAGGVPVLAHPAEYGLSNMELEETIKELKSYGLAGIEVMHPSTPKRLESILKSIAIKNDLIITGGSDYHNHNYRSYELGVMNIEYSVLSNLKEQLKN
jgi:predicted metal-dependent phosphoesterase TrpH